MEKSGASTERQKGRKVKKKHKKREQKPTFTDLRKKYEDRHTHTDTELGTRD